MNTIQYKLNTNQYISDLDLQIDEDSYITHLSADTGTGKSSWVMEVLSEQCNVVFAVPQLAQIRQLRALYKDRNDIDFVYGSQRVLSPAPTLIVCTYDQLRWVQSQIFADHFTLVVDEVHKLYQAASYRPDAIANLLAAIRNQTFANVITISATFTPELVPYKLDAQIKVLPASRPTHNLSVEIYSSDSETKTGVLEQLLTPHPGPVVVRINDKQEMQAYAQLLESKQLNCLIVNSDLQETESVTRMLTTESVAEYDVVLTTSLIDEAINIQDAEISEVIIQGSTIHPEELKQFIGRFRKTHPPIRLCIPRYRIRKQSRALNEVKNTQDAIAKATKQLAVALSSEMSPEQAVKKTNTTLASLLKFEPLRLHHYEIVANEPGIMASLYRADTALHYRSLDTLEKAFKDVLGAIKFTVSYIGDALHASDSLTANLTPAKNSGLPDPKVVEWCKLAVAAKISETRSGFPAATAIDLVSNTCAEDSEEYNVLRAWSDMHRNYIDDPVQALEAIQLGRQKAIMDFHETLEHNLILKPILRHLHSLPKGTEMTMEEARQHILGALRDNSKRYPPFKEAVMKARLSGIEVKRNNHFDVSDRFVRQIFKAYTATGPVRSNNKYRIVFNGLGPFGYNYYLNCFLPSFTQPKPAKKRLKRIKPKA